MKLMQQMLGKKKVDCPICRLWTLMLVCITAALCTGAFMLHCSGLNTQLALGCLGPASKDSKSSRVLIAIDYVFTWCLLPRRKQLWPPLSLSLIIPRSLFAVAFLPVGPHTDMTAYPILSRIQAELFIFFSASPQLNKHLASAFVYLAE